jgi:hypothetical protein
MKYEYTTVYKVQGIEHRSPVDIKILSDSSNSIQVVLTKNPDKFAAAASEHFEIMRAVADRLNTQDFLAAQMTNAVATAHCVEFEDSPHIVMLITGEREDLAGKQVMNQNAFVVHLNPDDPSESIRSEHEDTIAAVLASLLLETGGSIVPKKVWDFIAMSRDDGKRVVPMTCSIASEITDADPLDENASIRIRNCYTRLVSAERRIGTVLRLLRLSLEADQDKFRSFLFGWTALEFFVTRVFKEYEATIFAKLREGPQPALRDSLASSIQRVMRDKYRLSDKFGVMALTLCPTDADRDAETFRTAKKKRDGLAHGSNVDETELPVESVREILVKYLQLHLGEALRLPTARRVMKIAGKHDPFGKSAT